MHTIKTNMLYCVEELEKAVAHSRSPEEIERALYDISGYYHMAAVAAWLAEADPVDFFQYLEKSGRTRVRLLKWAARQKRSFGRFEAAGHVEPFFDAVASGVDDVARDIARLSATEWMEDDEYEDDFCYGRFLYGVAQNGYRAAPESRTLLDRFAQAMDHEPSSRLAVCHALLQADQTAYEAAMDQLIEERENYFAEREGKLHRQQARFQTEKRVFVEGLALARIGTFSGLNLTRERKTRVKENPGQRGIVAYIRKNCSLTRVLFIHSPARWRPGTPGRSPATAAQRAASNAGHAVPGPGFF